MKKTIFLKKGQSYILPKIIYGISGPHGDLLHWNLSWASTFNFSAHEERGVRWHHFVSWHNATVVWLVNWAVQIKVSFRCIFSIVIKQNLAISIHSKCCESNKIIRACDSDCALAAMNCNTVVITLIWIQLYCWQEEVGVKVVWLRLLGLWMSLQTPQWSFLQQIHGKPRPLHLQVWWLMEGEPIHYHL